MQDSKHSNTLNDSIKFVTPIEATTSVHEISKGTIDEETLIAETYGKQHMQVIVPKLIDTSTASVVNDCTANFEVPCTCQQQLLPVVQNNKIHLTFILQTAGLKLSKKLQGYIKNFSLVDGSKDKKTFNNCKRCVCPTVLLYLNKVTILGGSSDAGSTFKLGLYQLTHKSHYSSWVPVLNSKFYTSQLELKNSLCIAHGNDEVVVVSVSTKLTQAEFTCSLVLHLFSPIPIAGKYWRSTSIALPNAKSCDGRKYIIQSGIIFKNDLYCSLLLQGTEALVCKVDLQQCDDEAFDILNSWSLADTLLSDCFLSLFAGEVVAVTFKNVSDKTVMEVRQSSKHFTTSLQYLFEFPSIVKARSVAASVSEEIPHALVVIYHDSENNKCFVKTFYIDQ